ncbi:hypothetical protein [Sedimentitalea todarodis]|uniref:Uncharacterized protein n=1 Tax=Sedimentitalea todarodis TaxID=1631240 RepID=A0ABU3VJ12_9RHOB|nr:hypothetical protein [Sedimentitalea todarodis]MDU9006135.1 hypothetical protein [Sedimentitalea todarodis]
MQRILYTGMVAFGLAGAGADAADLTLTLDDLTRLGSGPMIAQEIAGLPADPALPVVELADESNAARQLRGLVARGVSQGFDRILYDNRDRDHSTLPSSRFPNLTFLRYATDLVAGSVDYGLAGPVLIPALVFGNSSTAMTSGLHARSLVRHAMTAPGGAARAYRDYVSNSLYMYPEHRDHDAVDLYPANWPYTTISQGSSGSDHPFMDAIAMTLAAFPADTRAALEENGLVAPTVQMIMRRNLNGVRTQASYLSAIAHPTVFSSDMLRPERMIGQAAAMRPDDIPPVVRLKIVEEDFAQGAGLAGLDEHLFTTPSAIARIWRSFAWERQMVVSAASTVDPNGHELRFDWVLLRGDPARVRIEPLGHDKKMARITVNWHNTFVLPSRNPADDQGLETSRVDIGVFAWNGRSESAPAIISISFPTHQIRTYEAPPGQTARLVSVDYDAKGREVYYDPRLHWSAPWVDRFNYALDGTLEGWTRTTGGEQEEFDAAGQPADGTSADYHIVSAPGEAPSLGLMRQGQEN